MTKKIYSLLAAFMFGISMLAQAQQPATSSVEMADQFRADGKIYVVIAVAFIVLTGMVTYLVAIERRLSKLEKETNV
jgi:hypothetical protein